MAKRARHKREVIEVNWKEVLSNSLKILGIIDDKFNGEVHIACNQGGVRRAKRIEELE